MDFRLHLIDRYVGMELKEYRRIFRTTDEAGQLDNISRRFAWFRRLLHTHELEQGRIFSAEWRVGWHLLARFTDITKYAACFPSCYQILIHWIPRDDIAALLLKAKPSLTVKVLLDNLQITTEFESAMAKKWATPVRGSIVRRKS
jgi:hypothetical protein